MVLLNYSCPDPENLLPRGQLHDLLRRRSSSAKPKALGTPGLAFRCLVGRFKFEATHKSGVNPPVLKDLCKDYSYSI